jgi:flagellar basal-body rod protein FlgB
MPVAEQLGMSDMFNGVSSLRGALDFHVERHNVLASNLANAETPGFHPSELVREAPRSELRTLPLMATTAGHFGAQDPSVQSYDTKIDTSTPAGSNGNSVNLEHEMAKLAANDLRYDGAAKMVSSKLAMLRYAANDGNG